MDGSWLQNAFVASKDTGAIYLFTCWDVMEQWRAAASSSGYRVRSMIVWDKMVHGLADLETCWAPQHEMILFAAKGRHVLRRSRPKDVIRKPRLPPDMLLHPYQKPDSVVSALMAASVDDGCLVVDPFMGSGTTLVAAKEWSCRAIGIEIDERYCEIAARRLSQGVFAFGDPL